MEHSICGTEGRREGWGHALNESPTLPLVFGAVRTCVGVYHSQ